MNRWGVQLGVWVLLLVGQPAAFAQADLPDLTKYRTAVAFDDPYTERTVQEVAPPPPADTSTRVPVVVFEASPKVEALMQMFRMSVDTVLQGYRIQIFSGEPDEISDIKFDFLDLFPDYGVYDVYEAPLWKVRVGDFVNRRQAEQFLNTLRQSYPNAFIVPAEVRPR